MMVLTTTRALSFFDSPLSFGFIFGSSGVSLLVLSISVRDSVWRDWLNCFLTSKSKKIAFILILTIRTRRPAHHLCINKTPVMFFPPSIIASRFFSSTCLAYYGVGCDFAHFCSMNSHLCMCAFALTIFVVSRKDISDTLVAAGAKGTFFYNGNNCTSPLPAPLTFTLPQCL